MQLYTNKLISYEEALHQCSNPDDFALKISGVSSTSDLNWDQFVENGGDAEKVPLEKF
jgi:twitching motility protein PilT